MCATEMAHIICSLSICGLILYWFYIIANHCENSCNNEGAYTYFHIII